MLTVERRLHRPPIWAGGTLGLGALSGLGAAREALLQINGWVVGLGALALEIAALIGALRVSRHLARRTATRQRRRLAQRHGWRYQAQATLPVPGPTSATRFLGVPTEATSTTGYDVLFLDADADGYPVTVFDRLRPQ